MIGTIEDKIIAHIKMLSDGDHLGYKLKQIATYSGELRNQAARDNIKTYPSVWLAFNRAPITRRLNQYDTFNAQFALLIATKNLRNEEASRHGGGDGEVGAYQISTDLAGVFSGLNFKELEGTQSFEVGGITPISVDARRNGNLAIYSVDLTVPFNNSRISPEIDQNNPLETIHTNWDLPPVGNVGPSLPDDENADANSTVTGD